MSIVLPFAPSFSVEDLSREAVYTVINTASKNMKLMRNISQTISPTFNLSSLIPTNVNKIGVLSIDAIIRHLCMSTTASWRHMMQDYHNIYYRNGSTDSNAC